MKAFHILFIIILLGWAPLTNDVQAAGTTCTVIVSGPAGHGYSYEAQFEIWDLWGSPPFIYQGPSSYVSVSVGTNYYVVIPYDVTPDCIDRWGVRVRVRQLQDGVPTGEYRTDDVGPLDSDEYESGGFILSVNFN